MARTILTVLLDQALLVLVLGLVGTLTYFSFNANTNLLLVLVLVQTLTYF